MSRKKVWNKGKIVGTKPALTPENVQAIRLILAQTGSAKHKALFAVAIDSSLRSIDLLQLSVMDVTQGGQTKQAARAQPSKTKGSSGLVVTFDLQKLAFRFAAYVAKSVIHQICSHPILHRTYSLSGFGSANGSAARRRQSHIIR